MTGTIGVIKLSRALTDDEFYYLAAFAMNKRMRRHRAMLNFMITDGTLEDPFRNEVRLPLGMDGCWFVGNRGATFDEWDASVFNKEQPPRGMPGCWCSWMPQQDNRNNLVLSGKKEHHAIRWASILVTKLLAPQWNINATGIITSTTAQQDGKIRTDIAIISGGSVITSHEKANVTPADQFK